MKISIEKFKKNIDTYLELSLTTDIYITIDNKVVSKLSCPYIDRIKIAKELVGIIPADYSLQDSKNERISNRIFTQKPRVLNTKLLEKLYVETHDKYIEKLKSPSITRYKKNLHPIPITLPKLSSFKFGKYSIQSRTEANLDSDNEEVNNNSLELKDHGHKEIYHQKRNSYYNLI